MIAKFQISTPQDDPIISGLGGRKGLFLHLGGSSGFIKSQVLNRLEHEASPGNYPDRLGRIG